MNDQPNPFAAGDSASEPSPTGRPSSDPSIEHEPHLQNRPISQVDSDLQADRVWSVDADLTDEDAIEHTVWDEPSLAGDLAGPVPHDQLTYSKWIKRKIAETTWSESWGVTCLVLLAAGPWGIAGAMVSQMSAGGITFAGLLAVAVLAPVTEEIMKVAAALWVVEKRPFYFKTASQILLCAAAGGLVFATIENLMYLGFYHPGGGAGFAAWRWVVCTALHVTCSTTAGVGLVRIWHDAIRNHRRPELAIGMPWFAGAMIVHGLYNTAVTLAETLGALSF